MFYTFSYLKYWHHLVWKWKGGKWDIRHHRNRMWSGPLKVTTFNLLKAVWLNRIHSYLLAYGYVASQILEMLLKCEQKRLQKLIFVFIAWKIKVVSYHSKSRKKCFIFHNWIVTYEMDVSEKLYKGSIMNCTHH